MIDVIRSPRPTALNLFFFAHHVPTKEGKKKLKFFLLEKKGMLKGYNYFSCYAFFLTIFSSGILAGSAFGHVIPGLGSVIEAVIGVGAVSETVVLSLCWYAVYLWTHQNRLQSAACLLICSSVCRLPVVLVLIVFMTTQSNTVAVVGGLALAGHSVNLFLGVRSVCKLRKTPLTSLTETEYPSTVAGETIF